MDCKLTWGFSSLFSLPTWPQPGRAQPVLVMNTEVPHSVYVPCLAIHNSSKLHQLWKSCLLISWARIIVSHKQDSLPLFDLESELVCKGPAGQHTPSIVTSYTMLTRTAHNIPRAVSLSSRTIVTLPWLLYSVPWPMKTSVPNAFFTTLSNYVASFRQPWRALPDLHNRQTYVSKSWSPLFYFQVASLGSKGLLPSHAAISASYLVGCSCGCSHVVSALRSTFMRVK